MFSIFTIMGLLFYIFIPISLPFSMWITILLTIYKYNKNILNWYAVEKNKNIFWQLTIIQYLLFVEWYLPKSNYLSYTSSYLNFFSLVLIIIFLILILCYVYQERIFSLYFSWFINIIFLVMLFIVISCDIFIKFKVFNVQHIFYLLLELSMLSYVIFCCIMLGVYFFLLWRRFNNIGIYYLIMVFSFWGILAAIIYSINNYHSIGFNYINIFYYFIIVLMFLTTYYLIMNNKLAYNKKHQLWGILFFPVVLISFFVVYNQYSKYIYKYNLINEKYNNVMDISVIINGISILAGLFIIFFILKIIVNLINWKIYV